jgi:hypothetical protein
VCLEVALDDASRDSRDFCGWLITTTRDTIEGRSYGFLVTDQGEPFQRPQFIVCRCSGRPQYAIRLPVLVSTMGCGTERTSRPGPTMSLNKGEPEVTGARSRRRD